MESKAQATKINLLAEQGADALTPRERQQAESIVTVTERFTQGISRWQHA
ncbi:MAG: hypothetical protein ACRC4U_02340 [Shewanella sp.]